MPGNKGRRGNTSDALILEAGYYAKTILVTNDPSLTTVAREHDVETLSFEDFMSLVSRGLSPPARPNVSKKSRYKKTPKTVRERGGPSRGCLRGSQANSS